MDFTWLISAIVAFPPIVYLIVRYTLSPFLKDKTLAKQIALLVGAIDAVVIGILMLPLFVSSEWLTILQIIPIVIVVGLTIALVLFIFLADSKRNRLKISSYVRWIAIFGYGFYGIVFLVGLVNNIIFFLS